MFTVFLAGRKNGFQAFKERNEKDRRVVDVFTRNLQDFYYNWNDHLNRVEPTIRNATMLAPTHRPGEYVEKAFSLGHPTLFRNEKRLKRENAIHSFEHVEGQRANLGEYIDLKLVPRTLYIRIRKGVQRQALQLLAKRIFDHAHEGDTQIVKQHNKRGKYSYQTWLSFKEMKKLDAQELMDKLGKVTRDRTRTITLIVRQKQIAKGNIHKLWETTFSLL